MRKISILIIGLGRVGGRFYQQFQQMDSEQVQIIGLSEPNLENPLLADAAAKGIQNFPDFEQAIDQFGEEIDIIMDTSNREELKQAIRQKLADTQNQHTTLIPMSVNYLMWYMIPGVGEMPQGHHQNIGY